MDCYYTECPKCNAEEWALGSSVYPMKLDYPECFLCKHQTKDADRELARAMKSAPFATLVVEAYDERIMDVLMTIGEFYGDDA